MTGPPLIEALGLTVTYASGRRDRHVAVAGVDLRIDRGQTVGLVGESGSGKSSFGAALLGLVPVTAGSVRFAGRDVTHASRRERRDLSRHLQVIFQDPYGSLNPARRIGDTLGEALRYNFARPAAEVDERVRRALAEVGLPESVLDRYPAHFSGGQRQRIAIARAVIADPAFIVCDEPVSALDLSVQAQVLNLLARLRAQRNLGYLFISHDISVVRYISDEIAVMYRGHIVEHGPAATVAGAPAHPYTRALLAAAPLPDPDAQRRARAARRALIEPMPTDARPDAGGCVFATRCPHVTDLCRSEAPPLLLRDLAHRVACHRQDELAPHRPALRNPVKDAS